MGNQSDSEGLLLVTADELASLIENSGVDGVSTAVIRGQAANGCRTSGADTFDLLDLLAWLIADGTDAQ